MIDVILLKNQLMESNCFIVVDRESKSCVVIDPATEKPEKEFRFIDENGLQLDYIIVSHTHADHCWGVNALKIRYPEAKLVYHEDKYMKREIMLFFRMWHEDVNYDYELTTADMLLEDGQVIEWHGHNMEFLLTAGHSEGSVCFTIEDKLFTGDTIMPFPPYFNGRGSNKKEWRKSVEKIVKTYSPDITIYPGHGEIIKLNEWMSNKEWINAK